jgi:hypothetical protein
MTPAEVIKAYRAAFRRRHKKTAPPLTYERGYYVFNYPDGRRPRYRRGRLLEMRDVLLRDAVSGDDT